MKKTLLSIALFSCASAYADAVVNFVNETPVFFKTGSLPEIHVINTTVYPNSLALGFLSSKVIKKWPNLVVAYITEKGQHYILCNNPPLNDHLSYVARITGNNLANYKCTWMLG